VPISSIQPLSFDEVQPRAGRKHCGLRAVPHFDLITAMVISCLGMLLLTIAGCGSGGYPGGGIEALSTSAVTIDAGQSYSFTTAATPGTAISYTLSGGSCGSGAPCGSLSNTTGATVVYTAPAGITSQSGSDAGERTADGDGGCSLHGKLESSGRDGPFDLGDYGGIDSAGFDI
jgi:hypothetical protein